MTDTSGKARKAYDTLARQASAGQAASIVVVWNVPGDIGLDGRPGPSVEHRYETFGAVFEFSDKALGLARDTLLQVGDRQLLLAALQHDGSPVAEPPVDAAVTLGDGSRAFVKRCKMLAPAGAPLLFDIVIKR